MSLLAPQFLLALVPLALLVWRFGQVSGPARWLRLALVTVLTLALARPEVRWSSGGADVVVVVDRSRSMPPRAQASAEELIHLVEGQRRPGDRVGVVGFGRTARVELAPTAEGHFGGFQNAIDGEASELAAGLDAAGELIPEGRQGRVLVVSDGRATGLDARAAARRLAARGVVVDYRWNGREDSGNDVAVRALEAPAAVAAREPFQLTAVVHAQASARATVTLLRGDQVLARTARALPAGDSVLTFRDLVESPGLAAYTVKVEADGDATVENDVGRALTRVEGPPRVLLLTDSPAGSLARTLNDAKVDLVVREPFALTMAALEGVGAVVLEDVEASRLTEDGLHVLAQYVREAGGGLVMTGGRHAFGEGGYRKSPVEDVLPVSLEVREEQRKAAVAISIIMDCSCSMGATVPDGRTKMELAAEGVVGALQLLNEHDEAAVSMVDTEPHVIFPMSPVSDGLPLGKVARGFSGGGGIYVGVGLREAKSQILKSSKPTRHVLLFSDAADSEEAADYLSTLSTLSQEQVTVSVIGMGKRSDSDAKLLEEVAARGNGRIYFAEDATSLPRIFSQETIAVARSSFVDSATGVALGPDLAQLGALSAAGVPDVGGYNLTYLRPLASVGLKTTDENAAPLLAMWPKGAGRVVAFTGDVDGQYAGAFKGYAGRRALFEAMVRWTLPPQANATEAVARATVSGNDLHVTLDFDRRAGPPVGAPMLHVLSGDAREAPVEVPMRWEDEDRVGAHFTLPGSGTFHPVVQVGERVYRAPPVTLSWAPEFEPGSAKEGRALLAAVAKAAGGVERLSVAELFTATAQSFTAVALAPALVALALVLLVAEVVLRRFFSGERRRKRTVAVAGVAPAVVAPPAVAQAAAPPPKPSSPPRTEAQPPPAAEPAPASSAAVDPLAAARERARKRTQR
ncbi:MAG: VWA domain-containing protein [Myxococcaceae bacterium]|nr:VWA domain-containing protein [Myxococcaceae bacterium]